MAPLFLIVGLINIWAQSKNYGIKIDNPDMIIRVRRDIPDTVMPEKPHPLLDIKNFIQRDKRQLTFYTSKYSTNGVSPNNNKLDYNFALQNNGMLNKFTRNYTINYYNNWRANYSKNNTNNGFSNRYTPVTNNSYRHYNNNRGYNTQFTSMPRFNRTGIRYDNSKPVYNYTYNGYRYNHTGNISSRMYAVPVYNKTGVTYHYTYPVYSQTPKYTVNTEASVPIYNYQDPNKNNFRGYLPNNGFNYYNVTVKPYAPGYLPIPVYNGISGNASSYWYKNFNVTPEPYRLINYGGVTENRISSTTEKILSGCIICNIGCPVGKHRSGIFCVLDEYEIVY